LQLRVPRADSAVEHRRARFWDDGSSENERVGQVMRSRTVIFAASESLLAVDVKARWAAPVLAKWPSREVPVCAEFLTIEQFAVRCEQARPGVDKDAAAPALVALEDDFPHAAILQLIDRLQRQLVPALLLFPRVDAERQSFQRGGIIVDSWDAGPERIANILYALGERQELVHTLARDLRVAHCSQGGLRGEMDKLHEEMNLAASVQRELLPRGMPKVEGLSFATMFRPVGYVSGDIYDVRQIDEHRVGFFLADAVGHGVPAALLTVALSRGLVTGDRDGDRWRVLEPSEVLRRLNIDLCERQNGGTRFATAVYGLVDARTRRVTIAGAGHPPPLVFGVGGMRKIETEGPLLGVFEEAVFDQTSVVLEPGETLVLYTDGMESAFPSRDEGANFAKPTTGYLRHLNTLAKAAGAPGGSLDEATRVLGMLIDDQAGSLHQVDDITTLAIGVPRAAVAVLAA